VKSIRFDRRFWVLLTGVLAVGFIASAMASRQRAVSYAEARTVVDRRCVECHSSRPTSRAFPIAPQGVMLDTAEQMKQYARRIEARVAVDHTMPLANISGMTDEERRLLGRWAKSGGAGADVR
jgi:uncharacterized membrane protein